MSEQSSDAAARVVPVPVLSDNYAYLIIDRSSDKAACVDPAEPEKVLHAAEREGVSVALGICTHKHYDHSGGNTRLLQLVPGLEILGSAYEPIPGITTPVRHMEEIEFESLRIRGLSTPCHTKGSMTFVVSSKDKQCTLRPLLFTGDTLFLGGCGRFFEGDAAQMRRSLLEVIGKERKDSLVYCGHEYSAANLRFALTVDPDNAKLREKHAWVCGQRESKLPTVPSSLEEEFSYNPFMRVDQTSLRRHISGGDNMTDDEVMFYLRQKKNNFTG